MRSKRSLISILVIAALSVVIVLGQTVAPTLLDFPSGTLIIDTINLGGVSRDTWPAGGGAGVTHDQDLNTTDDVTFASVDTGQGANELYDMDQNVLTTSNPTFGTIDTGQGANELYDMDQNTLTTSGPTFKGVSVDWIQLGVDNETAWPEGAQGPPGVVEGLPYAYLVRANATGTYVYNGTTGLLDFSNVDDTKAINYALSNLPKSRLGGKVMGTNYTSWQARVVLKGGFIINATIIIYQFTILDARLAAIYLASGSNCDMVRNYHYTTGSDNYISIWGGNWNANRAGNSVYGQAFNIQGKPDPDGAGPLESKPCWFFELGGAIRIYHCNDNSVQLEQHRQSTQWGSLEISNGAGHGLVGYSFTDYWWSGHIKCSSTQGSAVVLTYGGAGHFNTMYLGGDSRNSEYECQMYIYRTKKLLINQVRLDYVDQHGLIIENVVGSDRYEAHNIIDILLISQSVGANATYDAVRFVNTTNNIIGTFVLAFEQTGGSPDDDFWKYAGNEIGTCDWNLILSGKVEQYDTKHDFHGANSIFNPVG